MHFSKVRDARTDVLHHEVLFRRGHPGGMFGRTCLRFGRTAVQNAGLVEMDMRLHHARRRQLAAEANLLARRRDGFADIGDPTVIDDYVERSVGLPAKNRRLSKHRPHRVPRFPVFAPGLV